MIYFRKTSIVQVNQLHRKLKVCSQKLWQSLGQEHPFVNYVDAIDRNS